jgi:hypothetical protein
MGVSVRSIQINNLECIKFFEFVDYTLAHGHESEHKDIEDLSNLLFSVFRDDFEFTNTYLEFKRKCLESNKKAPLEEFLSSQLKRFKCKPKYKLRIEGVFFSLFFIEELDNRIEEAYIYFTIDMMKECFIQHPLDYKDTLHIQFNPISVVLTDVQNWLLYRWFWGREADASRLNHLFIAA